MTQEGDAHWVKQVMLLNEYGITPKLEWETRIGSFPMKSYCPCELWGNIREPKTQRQKRIQLIIAYYFQGVSYLVKVDQIGSKKQEDHFNLMGVPRPVWQLLVAMVASLENPESTG